jgi:hypothetical protein
VLNFPLREAVSIQIETFAAPATDHAPASSLVILHPIAGRGGKATPARAYSTSECNGHNAGIRSQAARRLFECVGRCPLWVITDTARRPRDVRFTPESGHSSARSRCPLCANSGHSSPIRSPRRRGREMTRVSSDLSPSHSSDSQPT